MNISTKDIAKTETTEQQQESQKSCTEMSYEELQEYVKQEDIQQVFKLNMFRYSDNNGEKDQFTDWARSKEIKGNGGIKTYGKARTDYDKKQDDKKKNKNKKYS